jgi:hypothetical protein
MLRSAHIVAVLTLFAAAAFGFSATGAPGASPSPQSLLAKYQPVTYLFDKAEWAPAPVESLIRSSTLARRGPDGTWSSDGVRLQSASQLAAAPDCASRLTCRLDELDCPAARLAKEGDGCYLRIPRDRPLFNYASVVYGSVRRNTGYRASAIPTILQYWYFYPLNWWRSTPARPIVEQLHEGDWESVTIGIDAKGAPAVAGYSQHDRGRWSAWSAIERRGTHPVVYVGRGSHASYFTPGRHRIPLTFAGPEVVALGSALKPLLHDYTCNRAQFEFGPAGVGPKTTAVAVFTETTDWATFRGAWGKGNFIFLPRGRTLLSAGASPGGPVYRPLWRDPLGVILRAWPKQPREPVDAAYCPSTRKP